jgi:carbonic anhydrase
MGNDSYGLIDTWLRNIKDVYRFNCLELDNYRDEHAKLNRLIELNIVEQVRNLAKTSIVQKKWMDKDKKFPFIHGWVYDLEDGIIKTLIDVKPGDNISLDFQIYKYKF